jgi:hypothetical protein
MFFQQLMRMHGKKANSGSLSKKTQEKNKILGMEAKSTSTINSLRKENEHSASKRI